MQGETSFLYFIVMYSKQSNVMIKNRKLAVIRFLLFWTLSALIIPLSAQEAEYPDYRLMIDSIDYRISDFFRHNKQITIEQLQTDVTNPMNSENLVYVKQLPARRKKTLTGNQLYKLCKKSTLMVGVKEKKGYSRFLATAVALTDDGICATNYHVLAEVILSGLLNGQFYQNCLYFVMQADGSVYPLKKVLAADPVNDFAIFQVETGKDKLYPMPLGNPALEGDDIYCLSHPQGRLFYLTKGIVGRNHAQVNRGNLQVRYEMQITADYAVGSSGGPIIDNCGNLVGLVSSTHSIYPDMHSTKNFQMSIKNAVPVKLLNNCIVLINNKKISK